MGPAGTRATTVDLAEQPIVLRNGLTVRQIRRRLANGRQVPVITTHPQMPLVQVAGAMFSRWSQENFFKYMREQFNLDSLPSHDLAPLDPDAQVVNPVRRALEKTIRRLRSRLATARNRLAEGPSSNTTGTPPPALRLTPTRLPRNLTNSSSSVPTRSPMSAPGDLPEQDKLDALPVGGRLFLDLVRMIAYRAETRHDGAGHHHPGQETEWPAGCCARLLTSDANIIPVPANGILRIQLLGARQRRLRPHARSPGRGTQCNPQPSIPAPISGSSTSWPAIRRQKCHLILAEVRKSGFTDFESRNTLATSGSRMTMFAPSPYRSAYLPRTSTREVVFLAQLVNPWCVRFLLHTLAVLWLSPDER